LQQFPLITGQLSVALKMEKVAFILQKKVALKVSFFSAAKERNKKVKKTCCR